MKNCTLITAALLTLLVFGNANSALESTKRLAVTQSSSSAVTNQLKPPSWLCDFCKKCC